ncbi:MAG: ATP-binding cassette domain-containing protein [Bacteriovoracaceae bacterium]|nr:ATP-binding cassette domain-containing protein [Bacteriovoracaceae bacterium]
MNSISTSKTILHIKSFNLKYHFNRYRNSGFRDLFISFIKNPISILFQKNEKISILEDINIKINKGQRVALIGSNGTGKTSLCRAIAGMHGKQKNIITNGQVRAIFDTSVVVQPELTGKENIEILTSLMFPTLSSKQRKHTIKEACEFSEIDEYLNQPFKHYSKGMKARLFLSVISSHPTDLLILDEVFTGADQFFNEKISIRLSKMIENSGAVIIISHDSELLKKICNRAIVLNEKKVSFDGDVDQAIIHYNNIHTYQQ